MLRKRAFKFGFLYKLAEIGVMPSEFQAALVKQGQIAKSLGALLAGLAISAPVFSYLLGRAGGAGTHAAVSETEMPETDPKMRQQYATLKEYRRVISDRKRKRALHRLRRSYKTPSETRGDVREIT